jgi:hypothetical protein
VPDAAGLFAVPEAACLVAVLDAACLVAVLDAACLVAALDAPYAFAVLDAAELCQARSQPARVTAQQLMASAQANNRTPIHLRHTGNDA